MTRMTTAGAAPAAAGGLPECTVHTPGLPVRLQWLKSFESGSAEIDALHRALLDECEDLLRAVESGAPWPRLVADAGRLTESCIQHFRHEEELLKQARFPRAGVHVAAHRRLEREMQAILHRMKMVDGSLDEDRAYARAFGPMLVDFIVRHDLDYRSHLMATQSR